MLKHIRHRACVDSSTRQAPNPLGFVKCHHELPPELGRERIQWSAVLLLHYSLFCQAEQQPKGNFPQKFLLRISLKFPGTAPKADFRCNVPRPLQHLLLPREVLEDIPPWQILHSSSGGKASSTLGREMITCFFLALPRECERKGTKPVMEEHSHLGSKMQYYCKQTKILHIPISEEVVL